MLLPEAGLECVCTSPSTNVKITLTFDFCACSTKSSPRPGGICWIMWEFPEMGGTPKWLVFNGKSHQNGGFDVDLGVPLFQETTMLNVIFHPSSRTVRATRSFESDSSPIFHTDACPKGAVVSILHQSRASNRPPT